jgi:hypothetical protein
MQYAGTADSRTVAVTDAGSGTVRHFTVEEANELLPLLTPVLEDLRRVHHRMWEAVGEVRDFEHRAGSNGHGEHTRVFNPENDVAMIQEELEQRLRYLRGIGVILKDIEHGILDFPTRIEGREIYLCWQLGEETIGYWHDVDTGFAGRQRL